MDFRNTIRQKDCHLVHVVDFALPDFPLPGDSGRVTQAAVAWTCRRGTWCWGHDGSPVYRDRRD